MPSFRPLRHALAKTVPEFLQSSLSEALKQDPLYYRGECNGVFPRLGHAVVSTFTACTGEDGPRVFSFPALVGPYAGSVVAVYVWYPNRYGAKDALRIGNYSLLEYMGGNIALEFLYMSPRSGLSRMHLNSRHGAPDPAAFAPRHRRPANAFLVDRKPH